MPTAVASTSGSFPGAPVSVVTSSLANEKAASSENQGSLNVTSTVGSAQE
jgi:hypothetical protein